MLYYNKVTDVMSSFLLFSVTIRPHEQTLNKFLITRTLGIVLHACQEKFVVWSTKNSVTRLHFCLLVLNCHTKHYFIVYNDNNKTIYF